MAKILVTGANGLLGVNFCEFASREHEVLGLIRRKDFRPNFPTVEVDIFNPAALESIIDTFQPDALLHTAAMANLEACEKQPSEAENINSELPGMLAEIARKKAVKFIHISTDAVFGDDGDRVFHEEDLANPSSVYARTKYKGELAVTRFNPSALIARVNFFGWSVSAKKSLAEFFFTQLSAQNPCIGFTDVYFCPLFVNDLSSLLLNAFEMDLSGVYHFTGSETLSKYDFGVRIAEVFGFNSEVISPTSVELSTLKVKRSHNLRLSNARLSTALGVQIPGVSTGIMEFYKQYQQSYPQKIKSYQQNWKRS